MFKLTIYEKGENALLPVHSYIEEKKEPLATLATEHMSNNADYVSILVTYKAHEVEIY